MVTSRRIGIWVVCVALLMEHVPAGLLAQTPVRPTFRTGVKLVSLAAVVRDTRGRIIRGLKKEDFQVLEAGKPRPIVNFSADDQGPISLAILFDSIGSMYVGSNLAAARAAVEHVLSWVDTRDEVALYSVHKQVHQEVAFTHDAERVQLMITSSPTQVSTAARHDYGVTSPVSACGGVVARRWMVRTRRSYAESRVERARA
jgi:VWFA-related protein